MCGKETLFRFKTSSSMEKVFPEKEPVGEGDTEILCALRGETVSFQICYFWSGSGKGRGNLEIVSPVKDFVKIRQVKLVPCSYPCNPERDEDYLITWPGVCPDLLSDIPQAGFPMIRGQWRSLWIDMEVPQEAEAGIYPVSIRMLKEKELLGTVEKKLQILHAVLPKLPVIHTEWLHTDCLSNYYHVEVFSMEYWRIVQNFVKAAVKRNCNMLLTPVFTPPLDTAVGEERRTVQLVDVYCDKGNYSFGYEWLERWVVMCQECGIEYFEISHLFSQWGAVAAPKIMAWKDGTLTKIFGWDTDSAGEEYQIFLSSFLRSFKEELEKLQIADKVWFHISDEPNLSQLVSYRAAKNMVSGELKGFQVFDALSDYEFYKEGLVEQPVCALDHMEPFLENPPEKLWCYYCTGQGTDVSNRFLALPGYRTRILGVQMYKYQIFGFLHWGFNFYNSECSYETLNPYMHTDADGAFQAGDPFLVYPGEGGEPEESIRMMLMDEAMNDLRAMKCLEELCGREAVMQCIESTEEEQITFAQYPRSISYLTKCRERINREIERGKWEAEWQK